MRSAATVVTCLIGLVSAIKAEDATRHTLLSPSGHTAAVVAVDEERRLTISVRRDGEEIVLPSPLGVLVDDHDTGLGVAIGAVSDRVIHEELPFRGPKSSAVNHCVEYLVPVTMTATDEQWTLEVRVFDDGVAYRYRIPGDGQRRIRGESTAWRLPQNRPIWLQNNTANYEGNYHQSTLASLHEQTEEAAKSIGCPITVECSDGAYALVTEACLYGYSGMSLRVMDDSTLQAVFQDDPDGWVADGEILSPWRVTVVAADLNALVNSDVIYSLGEAPDPNLFPDGIQTKWIQPGKSVCTWAVFFNDGAQWWRQKWFVDKCAEMGCEYLLVDGGWRTEQWGFLRDGGDLWERLTELCQYAKQRNVGIVVWNAYPEGRDDGPGLTDPAVRREYFRKCKVAGVQGVKIDFFDSESKATIDVYEAILRETAECQLTVNFHGANKPTGEMRTWPHEITREGLREQEYVLWEEMPLGHYGALPFTRMAIGHGDFLPGFVRPRFLRNTTATFQFGTTVIFSSPFSCWPDHPDAYLESPLLPLIRTVPTTWDETRVLDGSVIGRTVAMARRSGETWYVAILNCQHETAEYQLSLSFLGDGDYRGLWCRDADGPNSAQQIESGIEVSRNDTINISMKPGGGFVGRIGRPPSYSE